MTLAQLRLLLAVSEAGSFTLAGTVLGMTQSGVSQALGGLEDELGSELIERGRGGARLTALGRSVAFHAREALAHVESIRQKAADAAGLASGRLRIGCFPSIVTSILTDLLRSYRDRYPGIDVVVLEGSDAEIHGWLYARAVDLGIVTLPVEGLETTPMGRDEWLAIVPQRHGLANRPSVTLSELSASPFALSRGGCEARLIALMDKAGLSIRPSFEVRDVTTLLTMVRQRLGVSIVPGLALPQKFAGIRAIRLSPQAFRPFGLVSLRNVTNPPAVSAFVSLVKAAQLDRTHTPGMMLKRRAGGSNNPRHKRKFA